MRYAIRLAVALLGTLLWAQDDVAEVPSERLRADNDPRKTYFLIGPYKEAPCPEGGYRLLVILPGGDGSADFNPFCKRIYKYALHSSWRLTRAGTAGKAMCSALSVRVSSGWRSRQAR